MKNGVKVGFSITIMEQNSDNIDSLLIENFLSGFFLAYGEDT